jgi:hypothetical protein
MAGFIRWVDLPDGRQVELDNGVATVWSCQTQVFRGLYDNLPKDVLRFLVDTRVLVHAHYD